MLYIFGESIQLIFITSSKKWILKVIDQCVMADLMDILKQFNQNKTENEAVDIHYIK